MHDAAEIRIAKFPVQLDNERVRGALLAAIVIPARRLDDRLNVVTTRLLHEGRLLPCGTQPLQGITAHIIDHKKMVRRIDRRDVDVVSA